MEKIKIGIPKGLFYNQFHIKWHYFFEQLGCDVIESDEINLNTISLEKGKIGNEVCPLLHSYIGQVFSLQDQVDYIVIPKMEVDQKKDIYCPYVTRVHEIITMYCDVNILDYPIDVSRSIEKSGCKKIGKLLGKKYRTMRKAYQLAQNMNHTIREKEAAQNYHKLSHSGYKILMVGPSHLLHDSDIVKDLTRKIESLKGVVMMMDQLEYHQRKIKKTEKGNAALKQQLKGIIFISTSTCCFDVKLKEMKMKTSNLPKLYLNINDVTCHTKIEKFIKGIHEREG